MEKKGMSEKEQQRNVKGLSENTMMTLTDQAAYILREERAKKAKELGRKLNTEESNQVFHNVMISIINQYSDLRARYRDGIVKKLKIAIGTRLSERKNAKDQIKKTTGEQKQQTASELAKTLTEEPSEPIFSKDKNWLKMDAIRVAKQRGGDPQD